MADLSIFSLGVLAVVLVPTGLVLMVAGLTMGVVYGDPRGEMVGYAGMFAVLIAFGLGWACESVGHRVRGRADG